MLDNYGNDDDDDVDDTQSLTKLMKWPECLLGQQPMEKKRQVCLLGDNKIRQHNRFHLQ